MVVCVCLFTLIDITVFGCFPVFGCLSRVRFLIVFWLVWLDWLCDAVAWVWVGLFVGGFLVCACGIVDLFVGLDSVLFGSWLAVWLTLGIWGRVMVLVRWRCIGWFVGGLWFYSGIVLRYFGVGDVWFCWVSSVIVRLCGGFRGRLF